MSHFRCALVKMRLSSQEIMIISPKAKNRPSFLDLSETNVSKQKELFHGSLRISATVFLEKQHFRLPASEDSRKRVLGAYNSS